MTIEKPLYDDRIIFTSSTQSKIEDRFVRHNVVWRSGDVAMWRCGSADSPLAGALRLAVEQLPPEVELLVVADHVYGDAALHGARMRRHLAVVELRGVHARDAQARRQHARHEHVLQPQVALAARRRQQQPDRVPRYQVRGTRRKVRKHLEKKQHNNKDICLETLFI